MKELEKRPTDSEENSQNLQHSHDAEYGKEHSMLIHFAKGTRLHRFTAEKLADHCLPTTISGLQKKHAIKFSREWVEVPNRFKQTTRVRLYFLEGDNLTKARAIVSKRVRQ